MYKSAELVPVRSMPRLPPRDPPSLAVLQGQAVPLTADDHVLRRIEAVAIGPHRNETALRCTQHGDVSYVELWARTGGVASHLKTAGLQSGDILPIVQSWSLHSVATYLGALRANVIPLTLDPMWPSQRIQDLLRSISAKAVVTDSMSDETASDLRRIEFDHLVAPVEGALSTLTDLDQLAYAFFTSGSTGLPKCTLNYHRGLANRIAYMIRKFTTGGPVTVLLNSRPGFDSSLWQLLLPLCSGGICVIPRDEHRFDAEVTLDLLHRHRVTMTDVVPTTLNIMLKVLRQRTELIRGLGALHYLLVGGEELSGRLVTEVSELLPCTRVFNTYGPTETAIGVVFHEVDPDVTPVPLGRPIDNVFVAVCDEHGEPCSKMEHGEIVVGGECMGAGYLGNPSATGAAFIKNQLAGTRGDAVYRTGDYGYVDMTGFLHFRGRRDHQLKIGGVRGDLAEVEDVLRGVPGVTQAVAGVDHSGGRKCVYAFLVAERGNEACLAAAESAARRLPKAFVPRVIRIIDALPVTTSGKLDRSALHRIYEASAPDAHSELNGKASKNVLLQLEQFAALVLRRDSVDGHEDLFELGADSLSAVEITLEAERLLIRPVSLTELYRCKTLFGLVAQVSEPGRVLADSGLGDTDLHSLRVGTVRPLKASSPPQGIMLTGATGFIGSALLERLATTYEGPVYCLVRTASDCSAAQRLLAIRSGLEGCRQAATVIALEGDLTSTQWKFPAVRAVVHVAAEVNFAKPYELLRPANVLGTKNLIERSIEAGVEEFHYISSVAVRDVCKLPPQAPLVEDYVQARHTGSSYALSKWMGENLVLEAAQLGLKTVVYRLGEVGPATGSGQLPPRSLFFSTLLTFVSLDVWPFSGALDCTPLNQVCEFIACNVLADDAQWGVYNVVDHAGISSGQLLAGLRARGLPLEQIHPKLALQLLERGGLDRGSGLIPLPVLCALLRSHPNGESADWTYRFQALGDVISNQRYRAVAARFRVPVSLQDTTQSLVAVLGSCNKHVYR